MYDGRFHKVPEGWSIPTMGVLQMWRLWMMGNREGRVSPLRTLTGDDMKHLDAASARREGVPRRKMRRAVRTFCELKFLMEHIETKVRERGAWVENPNDSDVARMFASVSSDLAITGEGRRLNIGGRRHAQLVWSTVAKNLRVRNRQELRRTRAV